LVRLHASQKQDRQCTFTVTLRRVCTTFVAVEKQHYIFRKCVCSLRYPASKAHAPCCHLWPGPFYYNFHIIS